MATTTSLWYAIGRGYFTGVFASYDDARLSLHGYDSPLFKVCETKEEAVAFCEASKRIENKVKQRVTTREEEDPDEAFLFGSPLALTGSLFKERTYHMIDAALTACPALRNSNGPLEPGEEPHLRSFLIAFTGVYQQPSLVSKVPKGASGTFFYGTVWPYGSDYNCRPYHHSVTHTTRARAELLAIVHAVRTASKRLDPSATLPLKIFTTSKKFFQLTKNGEDIALLKKTAATLPTSDPCYDVIQELVLLYTFGPRRFFCLRANPKKNAWHKKQLDLLQNSPLPQ